MTAAVYYTRSTTDTVAVLIICLAPVAFVLLLAWLDSTVGLDRSPRAHRRAHDDPTRRRRTAAQRGRSSRVVGYEPAPRIARLGSHRSGERRRRPELGHEDP